MSAELSYTVADLYLRETIWEYSLAFDQATRRVSGDESLLAVISSPVLAIELLKRCPYPVHLAGTRSFDASAFVTQARPWAWGNIAEGQLHSGQQYGTQIWAEPEVGDALPIAHALRCAALAHSYLTVLASGPLRSHLSPWQTEPRPANSPLGPAGTRRVLRAAGWNIEGEVTYHGPLAIVWSLLYKLANVLGRPDWGDRCLFAMRASYQGPGWQWPLAPLALIRCRPA